jgi:hypothetical protein
MQDLASTSDPALVGSFKELTLLDPHPANSSDHFLSAAPNATGRRDELLYNIFVALTRDPAIVVPSNVNQAEVYYQQNPFSAFPASSEEASFNLWGDVRDITLQNPAITAISYYALNSDRLQNGALVGHSEVPLWFLQNVVPTLGDPAVPSSQSASVTLSPTLAVTTSLATQSLRNARDQPPSLPIETAVATNAAQVVLLQGPARKGQEAVWAYQRPGDSSENATDQGEVTLDEVTDYWTGFAAAIECLSF